MLEVIFDYKKYIPGTSGENITRTSSGNFQGRHIFGGASWEIPRFELLGGPGKDTYWIIMEMPLAILNY